MVLPYQMLPLFTSQNWEREESSPIIQVQGILRSGIPSGASIKAQISMKTIFNDSESETSDNYIKTKEELLDEAKAKEAKILQDN